MHAARLALKHTPSAIERLKLHELTVLLGSSPTSKSSSAVTALYRDHWAKIRPLPLSELPVIFFSYSIQLQAVEIMTTRELQQVHMRWRDHVLESSRTKAHDCFPARALCFCNAAPVKSTGMPMVNIPLVSHLRGATSI